MARLQHPDRRPVLIAGASAGIGAETARLLASLGYPVALGARRTDRLEELATEIRSQGGEVFTGALDIAEDDSVATFAAAAAASLGDIEAFVNCAARVAPGRLVSMTPQALAAEINVNLVGSQRLINALLPAMVARHRGDAVFLSSDVAIRPRPNMGGYTAGKCGLEGLVGSLQMELEGTGVRASIVRPGPTWSEMGSDWDPEEGAEVLNSWVKWGHARHAKFLKPIAIANAVATVIGAPRGVQISPIDVNPEAPVE